MLYFIIGFSIMVLIAPIGEAISEVKNSPAGKKIKNAFEGAAPILIFEMIMIAFFAAMMEAP